MVSEPTGGVGFMDGGPKPSRNRLKIPGTDYRFWFEDSELVGVHSQPLTVSSPCPSALPRWRRLLFREQSLAVWGFLLLWLEWIWSSPGLQLQPGDHWGSCAPVLPLRPECMRRGTQLLSPETQRWKNVSIFSNKARRINYIICDSSVFLNSFYKLTDTWKMY